MIRIREAVKKDLEGILDMWEEFTHYLESVEPEFFQLKPNARDIYRKILKKQINQYHYLVLVVEDEGQLVGYHVASIRYPGEVFIQRPYGHISDLYLKSNYRHRDLGREIVDYTRAWMKDRGIFHIDVKTFSANNASLEFWKKNGFESFELVFKTNLEKS